MNTNLSDILKADNWSWATFKIIDMWRLQINKKEMQRYD